MVRRKRNRRGASVADRAPKPSPEEMRDSLLSAACRVVERRGYKEASIALIADEANIATGSCYRYFSSRDDLLDELILWVREKIEEFLQERDYPDQNYFEYERAVISGYFEFQRQNSYFYRVLHESELETPETWEEYLTARFNEYHEMLTLFWKKGAFPSFQKNELKDICLYLMNLRKLVFFKYVEYADDNTKINNAIDTYIRFVENALSR